MVMCTCMQVSVATRRGRLPHWSWSTGSRASLDVAKEKGTQQGEQVRLTRELLLSPDLKWSFMWLWVAGGLPSPRQTLLLLEFYQGSLENTQS